MAYKLPQEAALGITTSSSVLLIVASSGTLDRLSDLSTRAGYSPSRWRNDGNENDSAVLLRSRISFIEVLPDWTIAIEILCRFKQQGFSGLVVLLGAQDAVTFEGVRTVGVSLGLHMAIGLPGAYLDAQVTDLLRALPAVLEPTLAFEEQEGLAQNPP